MKRTPISLTAFIEEKGVEFLAKKLGVNPSTVGHWRTGLCYPQVKQMRKIKKLSRGLVTYDTIIDGEKV